MNATKSKNFNGIGRRIIRQKHVLPHFGAASVKTRSQAIYEFIPAFRTFLSTARITEEHQEFFKMKFDAIVDPVWDSSVLDRVTATWEYKSGKFQIWSSGFKADGSYEMQLYSELASGIYRSGPCSDPEEFGRKFTLLVCEAQRIARLPWYRKITQVVESNCQTLMTFLMCISFIVLPQLDWEKSSYVCGFFALTAFSMLSYCSRIRSDDSLINSVIEQQAPAL